MNMKTRKRLSLFVVILVLVTSCLSACNAGESTRQYRKAVRGLEKIELTEEGTYQVSEELIIASKEAEYTEPKNIIYMIGDGMGRNIVETTREYCKQSLYEGMLAVDLVPQVGWQCTYSADAQITDSAAGGTALSTGYKTSNGTIAMDKTDTNPYQTVLELAAEKGKSTGIIATKSVTDATPASFTAHVAERGMEEEIAAQQIQMVVDGDLDLVLGGGLSHYSTGANARAMKEAQEKGVSYVHDWESTLNAELPVIGLYAAQQLLAISDITPTLAEMTDYALQKLSENDEGFFLMVEGSQIDTKAHANAYFEEVNEMYHFDCAIGVALEFVAMNPDTALVITADHETGGLHLPKESTDDVYSNYCYTTGNHTSIQVPVYAIGYGVEQLSGIKENVDVAKFVASLMGENDFGQKSEVYPLILKEGGEQITVSFDQTNVKWELPKEQFLRQLSSIKNARAIHINVKNTSDDKVHLPVLVLKGSGIDAIVAPQVDYLEAEEEMMLTYVLPNECWKDYAMGTITELSLAYESSLETTWKDILLDTVLEDATFEIAEIWITDRGLTN